jgi:hypothetical protein
MRNGEYDSKYQKDVVRQLKRMNALLLDHADHIIAMRAMLQIIMIYLPACASEREASRDAVMRIVRASHAEDKKLRKRSRKTLRQSS